MGTLYIRGNFWNSAPASKIKLLDRFFLQNWNLACMRSTKKRRNDEKSDKNPLKSARKVPFFTLWPEFPRFRPAFQARVLGPRFRPAFQARVLGPRFRPAFQARVSGPIRMLIIPSVTFSEQWTMYIPCHRNNLVKWRLPQKWNKVWFIRETCYCWLW